MVRQQISDALDLDLDAKDRRASMKLLHQLVVGPLAQETEAMYRALAQAREEEMTVKQRQEFPPVQTVIHTLQLGDGRNVLPGSKTAELAALEDEAFDGEWEEQDDSTDSEAAVLESE
jgi:hypothetical protein